MNNISEVEIVLRNINWSFFPRPSSSATNKRLFNCRKYHWYPATFIPEIPYTLIELLSKPGDKVFDPFLGIGTTFFQALMLNRIPLGLDNSYISIEYNSSLFTLFDPHISLSKIHKNIISKTEKKNAEVDYLKILNGKNNFQYLGLLQKWYSHKNFNDLCFLFLLESKVRDKYTKAAIKLSISSILSMVSNQDRGWGCIADNVLPKKHQVKSINVIQVFIKSLNSLLGDVEILKNAIDYKKAYAEVDRLQSITHANVKECSKIKDKSIDLIVTSPPYPNMVDYTTSQRLSYYYFGYDLNIDKENEIGARCQRKRKDALNNYLVNMKCANKNITQTLKKGGLLCYIMPSFNSNNNNNDDRISVVEGVISNLQELGLKNEIELIRSIPSLRRSHNKKWATLDKEKIYIFRKV